MTAKQFQGIRLGVAAFIAGTISYAAVSGSYSYAIPTAIVGFLLLLMLKRQVKEITHDERDLVNAGLAARYTILAYSLVAAVLSLVLFSNRAANPNFEAAASALAYSACALMLLHGLFFEIIAKQVDWHRNWRVLTFLVIIAALASIFTVRFFSGEDDYLCQNGQWVKHGQPNFPPPTVPCTK